MGGGGYPGGKYPRWEMTGEMTGGNCPGGNVRGKYLESIRTVIPIDNMYYYINIVQLFYMRMLLIKFFALRWICMKMKSVF